MLRPRTSHPQRCSAMKAPLAFGIGLASGLIIPSTLLLVLRSRDHFRQEAGLVTLREELSLARKAAERDREALRAAVQELEALRREAQPKPSHSVATPAQPTAIPGDSAIATYLGLPVPAPAGLDRKYSPEEIAAVFRDLAETLGIKIDQLAVDTTEFPFILHGRIASAAGSGFFKTIDAELKALSGYTYGGSVTGRGKDGSTFFALNMTPSRAYPREHAEAINRRMMLRLQIAAGASKEPNP
jgi:hypothetical protein